MQTLDAALRADIPSGATPSQATLSQIQTDLSRIHRGSVTGASAVAQIQADATAALASMGVSPSQISQIQADEQAVAQAIATARVGSATGASSQTPEIGVYLAGLFGPGLGRAHHFF